MGDDREDFGGDWGVSFRLMIDSYFVAVLHCMCGRACNVVTFCRSTSKNEIALLQKIDAKNTTMPRPKKRRLRELAPR